MHPPTHTQHTHTHIRTHIHTHTPASTHTHRHTSAHTHTHTHTHTHRQTDRQTDTHALTHLTHTDDFGRTGKNKALETFVNFFVFPFFVLFAFPQGQYFRDLGNVSLNPKP